MSVPAGVTYFNLAHLGVVRGTLEFLPVATASGILDKEVEYIDGRSELLGTIHAAEELDPILGVSVGEVRAIPFRLPVTTDTGFSVTFSNRTIFAEEKGSLGAVTVIGDYFIDRVAGTTGLMYVKLADNVTDPGTVNYYYVDPRADLTGKFSVRYETGEVFLHDATVGGLSAAYEYTNYKIKYNIARLVPSDDWEYDTSKNKITLKDREVLRNVRTPQATSGSSLATSKFYQASYNYVAATRADVSELEPFFTPTLKDYALKIITKSRLI